MNTTRFSAFANKNSMKQFLVLNASVLGCVGIVGLILNYFFAPKPDVYYAGIVYVCINSIIVTARSVFSEQRIRRVLMFAIGVGCTALFAGLMGLAIRYQNAPDVWVNSINDPFLRTVATFGGAASVVLTFGLLFLLLMSHTSMWLSWMVKDEDAKGYFV